MSEMRHRAVRRVIGAGSAVGIVAAALVGAASPASAATTWYVGPTSGTGGSCAQPDFTQIESAVTAATAGDTVHICEGDYVPTATIVVDKNLSFVGDDSGSTHVSGGDARRMFDLVAGATEVSFTELTMWNGLPSSGNGGAIRADVPGLALTITNCYFWGNTGAAGGGAIFAVGDVDVTNTLFMSNGGASTQYGGAIYSLGGTVTLTGSEFQSNHASAASGGGGAVIAANITVDTSTFAGNTTTASGGALLAGIVTVSMSTFINNTASITGQGGAIWANSASITTSSFKDNDAASGGAVGATGGITIGRSTFVSNGHADTYGGAARSNAIVQAFNSTFTENEGFYGAGLMGDTMALVSDTFAGNVLNPAGAGSSVLAGFISATNTIFADAAGWNCQITPADGGGNLSTDETCPGTRVTMGELNLQALGDNGGPTKTMALGTGSVAIDAGVSEPCVGVPDEGIDQRGATRPRGAACDSGAFEVGPVVEGQLPPPWYQAIGRPTEASPCPEGYLPSWAEWPNEGKGGFTCEKTTFWSTVTNGWVTKPGFVTRSLHRLSKVH